MSYIEKKRWYSANSIIKKEFFSWIRSLPTLTKWIDENPEIFKAIIKNGKEGKRYYLKGEIISEIIKKAEKGELKVGLLPESNN